MEDFSKYIIKDYRHWLVNLNPNQLYLGRCVIWCKREDALDLTDATEEEWKELLSIIKELKIALTKTFKPDWLNYDFLGNETRHLHGHFIPRYAAPRNLAGIDFMDKSYGHLYVTDFFKVPEAVLMEIKNNIIEALQ